MVKLGINVDHTATLRQARGTSYPDPVVAALLAEYAGCDSIVVHLREDRRHIKERDVLLVKKAIKISLNLEMSTNKNIVDFAVDLIPYQATLVPERRQELTTEGGLDLIKNFRKVQRATEKMKKVGIKVSYFIDPLKKQVKQAKELGADIVEINTGKFSEAKTKISRSREVKKIKEAIKMAKGLDFFVAVGHGIDYENIKYLMSLRDIEEFNIGHSVISRAVFTGMVSAVEEMLSFIKK